MNHLISKFHDLGLSLKPWTVAPNVRGGQAIFAMNIQGGDFLMQPGEGTDIQVQAADPTMKQMVLMVHELPRKFQVEISKGLTAPGDKIVEEIGKYRVRVERSVPEGKRHMLLGLDEFGHPFVTQLASPAISVKQAHEILKPAELKGVRVKGKGKNYAKGSKNKEVVRQGEWFFIKATDAEKGEINERLTERKVPIGPYYSGDIRSAGRKVRQFGGNPHTADELVVVRSGRDGQTRKIFVRGGVRHDEHATLKFTDWMRVERNTEPGRQSGVAWVD